MKYKVRFTVSYETWIDVKKGDLEDAITNIEIPETEETTYICDTFEVDSVENAAGKVVDPRNE